jgi:hypothetical protein
VAGLALSGLLLPVAAVAVEVPPVSGETVTVAVGESRKTLRLLNGEEVEQTAVRVSKNKLEMTRGDCVWSRQIDDIYGPNLTWKNCSAGAWGSGRIEEVIKRGQLWPLAVGNKVKYEYEAVNSKGKRNRRAFRACEVTGTEMVTAGGKDYATYRVECTEHNGKRVYNYAPEVSTTVRMDRMHKKRGQTLVEYIRDL